MQIEHLSNESAIDALKFGTKMTKLRDKITTNKPYTFPEAMAIATKLIDLDEDRRDMRKRDDERGPKRKEEKRKSKREYGSNRQRSNDKRYAPLNAPRSEILIWIKQNDIDIPTPRKLNPFYEAKRNKNRYCRYHRDHRHDIEECS